MFSLKGLTPYLWAISVLGGAYISYSLTSSYYQIKLVTMEKQYEQILNEAQKAKTQKEQEFFTEAINVQSSLSKDIQNVTSTYNHYFSDFLPGDIGRLQQSDNTSSSKDVSSNSEVTTSVSQSKCQCDGSFNYRLKKPLTETQQSYLQPTSNLSFNYRLKKPLTETTVGRQKTC